MVLLTQSFQRHNRYSPRKGKLMDTLAGCFILSLIAFIFVLAVPPAADEIALQLRAHAHGVREYRRCRRELIGPRAYPFETFRKRGAE